MRDQDLDSTLVRHGIQATTFNDMEEFVSEIEARPIEKLLGDLPGLARLSELKFELARRTLRRRFAELPEAERERLQVLAREVSWTAVREDVARIRSVFVTEASE